MDSLIETLKNDAGVATSIVISGFIFTKFLLNYLKSKDDKFFEDMNRRDDKFVAVLQDRDEKFSQAVAHLGDDCHQVQRDSIATMRKLDQTLGATNELLRKHEIFLTNGHVKDGER